MKFQIVVTNLLIGCVATTLNSMHAMMSGGATTQHKLIWGLITVYTFVSLLDYLATPKDEK